VQTPILIDLYYANIKYYVSKTFPDLDSAIVRILSFDM